MLLAALLLAGSVAENSSWALQDSERMKKAIKN
jgi:hypothetical protein